MEEGKISNADKWFKAGFYRPLMGHQVVGKWKLGVYVRLRVSPLENLALQEH